MSAPDESGGAPPAARGLRLVRTAPDGAPAPRFSVVVPTYDRADSVGRTLASVFDQGFGDFEVVVVDDGSTNDTLERLARIDDARLVVATQPNAGPAAARNRGMEIARGAHVAFLDSDDRWHPDFLGCVARLLDAEPDVLVYGQIVVDRGVGRYWIKPDRALGESESIYEFLYVHGGFIQTSTMVVPARLAREVAWDESVTFGDNDQFAIDCRATGIAFRMLPRALVLYEDRIRPDALSQLPIHAGHSPKHTNFFRWMETRRSHMSERAWLGFSARYLSVGLARRRPVAAAAGLWRAWRAGAIGPGGVARQTLQNHAPRLYRRLTDRYVAWRGQPRSGFEP